MYPLEIPPSHIGPSSYAEHFSEILKTYNCELLVYSRGNGKIYCSAGLLNILEYPPSEVPDTAEKFTALQHPDDIMLIRYLDKGMHPLKPRFVNLRLRKKSGLYIWIEVEISEEYNEINKPSEVIMLVRDITERIIDKPGIPYNEMLNDEISRISRVGGWERDLRTGKVNWTSGMFHVFEVESQPPFEEIFTWILEEYRPLVNKTFKNVVEHKTAYSLEFETYTAKKRKIWVHTKAEPVFDNHGNVIKVRGIFRDIDEERKQAEQLKQYHADLEKTKFLLDEVSKMGKFGLWETGIHSNQSFWSRGMFEIHELPYDMQPSIELLSVFHPVKHNYEEIMSCYNRCLQTGASYEVSVPFTTFKGNHRWMRLTGMAIRDHERNITGVRGLVQDITEEKQKEQDISRYREELEANHFILSEAGSMAHIGGWQLDVATNQVLWSQEVFKIHEMPFGQMPTLDEMLAFYAPKSRVVLKDAIRRTVEYLQPYDLELELLTAKKNKIWIRCIGKPALNEHGLVTELRGVLQNIMEYKHKEQQLEHTNRIIKEQNSRLENFAQIVSHNLRSHASTFSASLEALRMAEDEDDRQPILASMDKIAANLHETLHHLSEVVKIKTNSKEARQKLLFSDVVNAAIETLGPLIKKTGATIHTDFSECPQVDHIPAYLDSIVLNLISNAIKYRSPDRAPEITIAAKMHHTKKLLTVSDNGLGIDLHKHGTKLFGIYKTFHNNPDSKGVGLFITKNQIESLGGSIEVKSKPGIGTVFTITFL
ncbi:PAS domain-containing sensor histidine kinase [Foetidibacter luteolus]|uniref:PAS domain-containing sensor histidine kinase n=1 Tax=Foetidibacter luteolus TaxID=2608880 RepID=UPI00129C0D61|nr:HAMP domain-containing sensor histidine kinase [Foetidibacter luteolus]